MRLHTGWFALSLGGVLVALVSLASSASATLEAIAKAAGSASNAQALAVQTARLEESLARMADAAKACRLQTASDTVGALVARARDLDLDGAEFARLVAVGENLEAAIRRSRELREDAAGEDDAALEALFRSADWSCLDYAEVVNGYWTAWARLERALRLAPGRTRGELLREAERGFARAAVEVRLPALARSSRFGLGQARRQLGDPSGAKRAFESLETLLAEEGATPLLDAVRFELTSLAFEQGDLDEAARRRAQLASGRLSSGQALALAYLEAQAWLNRVPQSEADADRAAAALRVLTDAGGAHAQSAAALALAHREALQGRSVGPAGDLVAAEAAFEAQRFESARDAYARFFAAGLQVPGLDAAALRYRYALSLAESGRRADAVRELERLATGGAAGSLPPGIARLRYSLAAQEAAATPSPAAVASATRAAAALLEAEPGAPEADAARLQLARQGDGAADDRIALLEAVPPQSGAYPSARLDLVYRRAESLRALETRGQLSRESARQQARKLLSDLRQIEELRAAGRLDADAERDAALAVLSAKATAWAGEPPGIVLAEVARVEARNGIGEDARQVLVRLRLAALVSEGRFEDIEQELARSSDAEVARRWSLWMEALQQIEKQRRDGAPTRVRIAERLEPRVPSSRRDDVRFARARALLDSGRAEEAVALARSLVAGDSSWGDARLLEAQALEAAGDSASARIAWRAIVDGVEPGSRLWLEAELGVARSAARAGDREAACAAVASVRAQARNLDDASVRRQIEALGQRCPESAASE